MKSLDELTRRSATSPNLWIYNCSAAHCIGARSPPATVIREFRIRGWHPLSRFYVAYLPIAFLSYLYARSSSLPSFSYSHSPQVVIAYSDRAHSFLSPILHNTNTYRVSGASTLSHLNRFEKSHPRYWWGPVFDRRPITIFSWSFMPAIVCGFTCCTWL